MKVFNLEKGKLKILAKINHPRKWVEKQENISFDKDWMNRIHYEERSVINLTNHMNSLGDNGVDRVDM